MALLVTGVHHVALWVHDLGSLRSFYVERLGGRAGPEYRNPVTGLRSCFISFGAGARVELMSRPDVGPSASNGPARGYAHVALSTGSRPAVDALVGALEAAGVTIQSRPRVTGDGYYEAVVLDPEGNPVELTE